MTRNTIIQTLIEQLESEAALGGRWLPVARLSPGRPAPVAAPAAPTVPPPIKPQSTAPYMAKEPIPAPPRGTGKNQKQLDEIAARALVCKQCSLHKTRNRIVPGEGNPNARIVFVGEAPGADEDQQGRPFVGRAGQFLNNVIKAMGLDRSDVFICNVLKCRPPDNRDPSPAEKDCCIGFLTEQLKILNPDIIVALGAHAAKTLLKSEKSIGELRGRFHAYQPADDMAPIKLIATYHPAYVLRNYTPDTRGKVWDDMKKVLAELGLPIPEPKK